jgi:hypothetical protein
MHGIAPDEKMYSHPSRAPAPATPVAPAFFSWKRLHDEAIPFIVYLPSSPKDHLPIK